MGYPRMPRGTCLASSRYLASRYPELELRAGVLRWRERGLRLSMPHVWNVTPDGEIVDSTWEPSANVTEFEYVVSEWWTRACR
jgi:hypothetical protein